jgi:hypothetical protein
MSTPFGPAAVLDTVKNRQQLTLVCLRLFVSWLLCGLSVKTWKEKADEWNNKNQRVFARNLGKLQS